MDPTEPQALAVLEDLLAAEAAGELLPPFALGPYSAYVAIAALQLVTRHPDIDSPMRDMVTSLARQLTSQLPDDARRVAELGFDPANDVHRGGGVS